MRPAVLNYKKPHVRGPRNYFSSWAKQGHGIWKNLPAGGPRWECPGARSSRPVSRVCQAGACKPCNQQGGEFSSGQERKDWVQSWRWGPHKTSSFLVLQTSPHPPPRPLKTTWDCWALSLGHCSQRNGSSGLWHLWHLQTSVMGRGGGSSGLPRAEESSLPQ